MPEEIKKFKDLSRDKEHEGVIVDTSEKFDVIDCQNCGFKHVIPVPEEKDLQELYCDNFYSVEKKDYLKEAEEDAAWWEATYKSYYQLFEKHCPGAKRLLDIGSGPGYFLKVGKELGWDVLGFEPSKQASEYSRQLGVNIINDFFSEKYLGQIGKFDVIHSNTVIEHLADPISLVRSFKEALSPEGLVCIVAPNDYNPLQDILRNKLGYKNWWVLPPQHINYFNFGSIARLLEKEGFSVVESLATFPMEFFLLGGDNYVGNGSLGRSCHRKRKEFELNMYKYNKEGLNAVYKTLAQHGMGREFVVIGRIIRK